MDKESFLSKNKFLIPVALAITGLIICMIIKKRKCNCTEASASTEDGNIEKDMCIISDIAKMYKDDVELKPTMVKGEKVHVFSEEGDFYKVDCDGIMILKSDIGECPETDN